MPLCPKCGNLCSHNNSFCDKCGTNLGGGGLICPVCVSHNPTFSLFCNQCGYRLNSGQELLQRRLEAATKPEGKPMSSPERVPPHLPEWLLSETPEPESTSEPELEAGEGERPLPNWIDLPDMEVTRRKTLEKLGDFSDPSKPTSKESREF